MAIASTFQFRLRATMIKFQSQGKNGSFSTATKSCAKIGVLIDLVFLGIFRRIKSKIKQTTQTIN